MAMVLLRVVVSFVVRMNVVILMRTGMMVVKMAMMICKI